jgi:hypothetical protein
MCIVYKVQREQSLKIMESFDNRFTSQVDLKSIGASVPLFLSNEEFLGHSPIDILG